MTPTAYNPQLAARRGSPRERPIIFSAAMVRSLLGGSKTQTRRTVTLQPPLDCGAITCGWYHPTRTDRNGDEYAGPEVFGAYSDDVEWGCVSRFVAGHRLYVKEAFTKFERVQTTQSVNGGPFMPTGEWLPGGVGYRADADKTGQVPVTEDGHTVWRTEKNGWCSPLFMPRWASRITLEVTDVRCERLHNITEEDAIAEGVTGRPAWTDPLLDDDDDMVPAKSAREVYAQRWQEINRKRAPWASNPFVWAITYRRIT